MQLHRDEASPELTEEEEVIAAMGEPAVFLETFLKMSRSRRRGRIGWTRKDLAWTAKAWDAAAIASVGNPHVRDACIHERDRYRLLYKNLERGQMATDNLGVVFLNEPSDWPHPKAIEGAIVALRKAEILAVFH